MNKLLNACVTTSQRNFLFFEVVQFTDGSWDLGILSKFIISDYLLPFISVIL